MIIFIVVLLATKTNISLWGPRLISGWCAFSMIWFIRSSREALIFNQQQQQKWYYQTYNELLSRINIKKWLLWILLHYIIVVMNNLIWDNCSCWFHTMIDWLILRLIQSDHSIITFVNNSMFLNYFFLWLYNKPWTRTGQPSRSKIVV